MDYGELKVKTIVFEESLSFSFIIVVMAKMSWQFNTSPSASHRVFFHLKLNEQL